MFNIFKSAKSLFSAVKTTIKKSYDMFHGAKSLQTGERDLNSVLNNKLDLSEKFTDTLGLYKNPAKFYQKIITGQNIIIADTAHDTDKDSRVAYCNLYHTLEELKSGYNDNKTYKILIPIGQKTSYGLGLLQRGHYTLLELDIVNKKLEKATHIDSKGIESSLYGLSHIEEMIQNSFDSDISLTKIYTGEQHFSDNVNCGRFVTKTIIEKTTGKTISNTGKFFDEFNSITKQASTNFGYESDDIINSESKSNDEFNDEFIVIESDDIKNEISTDESEDDDTNNPLLLLQQLKQSDDIKNEISTDESDNIQTFDMQQFFQKSNNDEISTEESDYESDDEFLVMESDSTLIMEKVFAEDVCSF